MASIVALAVFSIGLAPIVPAFAEGSEGKAWGEVTSEGAVADGQATGQHASDPNGSGSSNDDRFSSDDPGRDGLGNLKNLTGDWCELADFLGSDPESCPDGA